MRVKELRSTRRRTNSPTDQLANAKTSVSWSSIQYNLLEGKHTEKQTIFSKKTLVNIGEHLTEA